ncbi:MAG: response regulator [Pseudomonadota bacterium]
MSQDIAILVIDDMGLMRKIVRKQLAGLGFTNIIEAENGNDGLAKLASARIDLILCDWNMPNMNGLDFLKSVKNDPKLKHIPFIMVTAERQKVQVLAAVKAGASGYLAKPFTPESLKEQMDRVLLARKQ